MDTDDADRWMSCIFSNIYAFKELVGLMKIINVLCPQISRMWWARNYTGQGLQVFQESFVIALLDFAWTQVFVIPPRRPLEIYSSFAWKNYSLRRRGSEHARSNYFPQAELTTLPAWKIRGKLVRLLVGLMTCLSHLPLQRGRIEWVSYSATLTYYDYVFTLLGISNAVRREVAVQGEISDIKLIHWTAAVRLNIFTFEAEKWDKKLTSSIYLLLSKAFLYKVK